MKLRIHAKRKHFEFVAWSRYLPHLLKSVPTTSNRGLNVDFSRCQHSSNDGGVEFVLAVTDVACVVFDLEDKDRQATFFVEGFLGDGDGQHSAEAMLAIGGFVAVFAGVPGEDSYLVKIEGQAVVRIGQDAKVLRNVSLHAFVGVGNAVELEKSNETLAFGVLRDFDGSIDIDHTGQDPTHAPQIVAH